MPFPILPIEANIRRLAAIITEEFVGDDDAALVRLFKNDVNPDPNMTVETFEEADFAGYVPQDPIMQAPFVNDQGMVVSTSVLLAYNSAAGVDPQTVYGIFVSNPEGTRLVMAQRFDEPQQMGGALPQSCRGILRASDPPSSIGWLSVEG